MVRFTPARELSGSHTRSRIFIRHHDISCSAHSPALAKSKPRGQRGRRSLQDPGCEFRSSPRPRRWVNMPTMPSGDPLTKVNRPKNQSFGDASVPVRLLC